MVPPVATKKAPKKAPKKHEHPNDTKDARRAFEHLSRVEAILGLAKTKDDAIGTLILNAKTACHAQRYKESTDLLRAAEHLSFASIVGTKTIPVSPQLARSIQEEFEHLLDRAEEHGHADEAPIEIRRIYQRIAQGAQTAMDRMEYCRALELARSTEALTHVGPFAAELPFPDATRRLKG